MIVHVRLETNHYRIKNDHKALAAQEPPRPRTYIYEYESDRNRIIFILFFQYFLSKPSENRYAIIICCVE